MSAVDLPGVLVLADGRSFRGVGFGARATVVGEVVFNTSMTGYQEIITDPSYTGQVVCLTVAEVGNVGTNPDDDESRGHGAEGLLVRSLSPAVSNWRARESLPDYLARRKVPGLSDFDTRALTRHLRTQGSVMGALSTETSDPARLLEMARSAPPMEGQGLATRVTTPQRYAFAEGTLRVGQSQVPPLSAPNGHVVAVDYGIKLNILRCLVDAGVRVTVVPAHSTAEEILALEPDGVVLGNGPGDPSALPSAVAAVRSLLQAQRDLPVFGICLGHQLLCLALGGRTTKLKFGHHGGNHPVRSERDAKVEITAQNHCFAVDAEALGAGAIVSHVNLFDGTVAGMHLSDRPVRSVQYHPEASPGPHDATHLFAEFVADVRARRSAAGRG